MIFFHIHSFILVKPRTAFGVVNFITLSRESKDTSYLARATRLAETVHDVLGRTRDGKARLPGATDQNPLGGGLRIGKTDEQGSDGDGQYHHYLTVSWIGQLDHICTQELTEPTFSCGCSH